MKEKEEIKEEYEFQKAGREVHKEKLKSQRKSST